MPDIFGPDISESEARALLCKELGCKPIDVQISCSWCVTVPNPKATGYEHQFIDGGTLRESAGLLKQAVSRILVLAEN